MADAINNPKAAPIERPTSTLLQSLVIVAQRHGMHLTVQQIVQDSSLPSDKVTPGQLVLCARKAGLKAKSVKLAWTDLKQLKKALPAIVTLTSGASMVLVGFDSESRDAVRSIARSERRRGRVPHDRPNSI